MKQMNNLIDKAGQMWFIVIGEFGPLILSQNNRVLAPLEKSHRRRANNGGSGFHRYQCMSI